MQRRGYAEPLRGLPGDSWWDRNKFMATILGLGAAGGLYYYLYGGNKTTKYEKTTTTSTH